MRIILCIINVVVTLLLAGCATRQPVGKIYTGYEEKLGPIDKITMVKPGFQAITRAGGNAPNACAVWCGDHWAVYAWDD